MKPTMMFRPHKVQDGLNQFDVPEDPHQSGDEDGTKEDLQLRVDIACTRVWANHR